MKCRYKILLSFLLWSSVAKAAEPAGDKPTLKITAQVIPYFIDSETEGTFIHLTEEIARRLNIKIEFDLYPNYRALEVFKKRHALILLPGSHPKLKNTPYYQTDSFFLKEIYIFSKTPQKFSTVKDLSNHRVGKTLGFTYPDLSSAKNVDIQIAPSDEANLMKLHHNRLDAFLGEAVSVSTSIQRAGFKDIKTSDKPLTSEPIFYAFQKTAEGKIWMQKFNEVLRSLKKSGQLDKILNSK